jgi:hypothetical protein
MNKRPNAKPAKTAKKDLQEFSAGFAGFALNVVIPGRGVRERDAVPLDAASGC